MKFHKDILIIDFEATGNNPKIHQPIQLSAILLDKDTLREKASFNSYIKADLSSINDQHVADILNNINQKTLDTSPTKEEVISEFIKKFGTKEYFLASWVFNLDFQYLLNLLDSINISINEFDYHFIDIWPIAYFYLLKSGYTGGIRSEEMFSAFGINKRTTHDGLDDCRIEATILRQIAAQKYSW